MGFLKTLGLGAVAGGLLLSGCADQTTAPDGPGVAINVAPLSLPGVTDVCYTLEVRNEDGQTVWTESNVCADQFGDNKSAISYVGTCDADSDVNSDGKSMNTVTLTIENIYSGEPSVAVADSEWQNPCSTLADGSQVDPNGDGYGPCQLDVECVENTDSFVEFNITVMRDANQGFFDIAVNFEDIFCSAKIDCQYPDPDGDGPEVQAPIALLHNPNTGVRDNTIVLGRACSAGVGEDTQLHTSPAIIYCGWTFALGDGLYNRMGVTFTYDPTSGDGNQLQSNVVIDLVSQMPASLAFSAAALAAFDAPLILWQNANYSGTEQLTDGTTNLGKIYQNQAIGFDFQAFNTWWQAAEMVNQDGVAQGTLGDIINPPGGWNFAGCGIYSSFTATDAAGIPAPSAGSLDSYPLAMTNPAGLATGYPYMGLSGANGDLTCTQHPLDNSGDSGLGTTYLGPDTVNGLANGCMTSDGAGNPLTDCP